MAISVEDLDLLRITPTTEVQHRDFLFTWRNIPCFPRGELVAITGKAKCGKTYLCSMLMALCEQSTVLDFKRPAGPIKVLWLDTEQSEDSTQEILLDRIRPMVGHEIDNTQFFIYNLRRINWQDRLSMVEMTICNHLPDLIILDGIRDVVGDINDYLKAQEVLETMLHIASFANACIVCVLHQNKAVEDKTLRGALGTELQNKSFETYECAKDPETHVFTIRQTATRKYDIMHKMQFRVNDDGLPCPAYTPGGNDGSQPPSSTGAAPPTESRPYVSSPSVGEDTLKNVYARLKKSDKKNWTYDNLKTQIQEITHNDRYVFLADIVKLMTEKGMLQRNDTGHGIIYQLIRDDEPMIF